MSKQQTVFSLPSGAWSEAMILYVSTGSSHVPTTSLRWQCMCGPSTFWFLYKDLKSSAAESEYKNGKQGALEGKLHVYYKCLEHRNVEGKN